MSTKAAELEELSTAIHNYCYECRGDQLGSTSDDHLDLIAKKYLPQIYKTMPNLRGIVACRKLVELALQGLADKHLRLLWELYFSQQESPKTIAFTTGLSIKTINLQLQKFSKRLAVQLWKKTMSSLILFI